MYYLALLTHTERDLTPDEGAAEMAAYEDFHRYAWHAIRAGDALASAASAVRISGGPDRPTVTDGPFPEGAEVAGGYYVFEADNLDDALELARRIPAARYGAVELRPIAHWKAPTEPVRDDWLALVLDAPENVNPPSAEEFEQGLCDHAEFGRAAGDRILGGAPLQPPVTATTVRVRDGEAVLTDGPFAEGAEVVSGFYLLRAADREEAIKIASMIPSSAVELRRLAGISGL
jgi:hypothetical protein